MGLAADDFTRVVEDQKAIRSEGSTEQVHEVLDVGEEGHPWQHDSRLFMLHSGEETARVLMFE